MSWLPEFTSLVELGKPQEAEAYLLKIQGDSSIAAVPHFVHLQLGMLYQNHLQKPDLARTHYLQSLALNPRSGLCHYNLGVLLTTHYHEHVAARDHLLQAQSFGYFWSHFKLARLLEHQLCDYDRAEHHYKEALLDGRPQSKLFYARFLRKHRPLETELQQQNYCKVEPSHFDPTKIDDAVYQEDVKRNFAKAQQLYLQLLQARPLSPFIHFNYGLLLKDSMGQPDQAKHEFDEVLKLDPHYAEAHFQLGFLLFDHFAQYDAAREHFAAVLAVSPAHAQSLYFSKVSIEDYLDARKAAQAKAEAKQNAVEDDSDADSD